VIHFQPGKLKNELLIV